MENSIVLGNVSELDTIKCQIPTSCQAIVDDAKRTHAEIFDQIDALTPGVVQGVQTANLMGAYKIANNVVLEKGADGLYAVVERNSDGTIVKHAKLTEAQSALANAAAMSFTIANIVVGQANMMTIAERLKNIEKGLEEQKQSKYTDVFSEIAATGKSLNEALKIEDLQVRRSTFVLLRRKLDASLRKLKEYILQDIQNMPRHETRGFWDGLLSDWGSKDATRPEIAKKHFEYIRRAFPVWCEGMLQYVLSDAYLDDTARAEMPTAKLFVADIKEIIIDSGLGENVRLVPMIGDVDPIEIVNAFRDNIPKMEQTFAKIKRDLSSGIVCLKLQK